MCSSYQRKGKGRDVVDINGTFIYGMIRCFGGMRTEGLLNYSRGMDLNVKAVHSQTHIAAGARETRNNPIHASNALCLLV